MTVLDWPELPTFDDDSGRRFEALRTGPHRVSLRLTDPGTDGNFLRSRREVQVPISTKDGVRKSIVDAATIMHASALSDDRLKEELDDLDFEWDE
jgi:hypothetical protein